MASEVLGWSAARTAAAVDRLCRYRLLVPLQGDDGSFGISTPRDAVSHLLAPLNNQIETLEQEVSEVRTEFTRYQQVYADAEYGPDYGREFRTFVGIEAINAELETMAEQCQEEVLTAQPGGGRSAESLAAAWESTQAMLERGVQMRTVYQHSARFNPATRKYVNRVVRAGGAVRTLDEFFERLIIFDRKVAFIPARSDRQIAIAVYQPAVVDFLVGAFERAWMSAAPFSAQNRAPEVKHMLSDIRLSIVKLLAEGETDESIARRMGVSVRTCRTHISKIYEELGARSRCELGVLIERSGLLDSPGPETAGAGAPAL
ncbi:LuxR C-terminal-related transcriptional regulator [Streptomyces sp. NPDC059851]|uniref:helix-turn-helix transcriptional regulator n=1 Tax=Streptomyces sp. NPDC059851 TaxID=3346971 RepID=UPI003658A045